MKNKDEASGKYCNDNYRPKTVRLTMQKPYTFFYISNLVAKAPVLNLGKEIKQLA